MVRCTEIDTPYVVLCANVGWRLFFVVIYLEHSSIVLMTLDVAKLLVVAGHTLSLAIFYLEVAMLATNSTFWNWSRLHFIQSFLFHIEAGSPYFAHGGILKLCKINEFWTCWTKLNSLRQFTFLVKVNASRCGRSCYNRFNPVGIHCPAIKVICILLLFSYCLLLFYLVLWLWPWHS